MNTDDPIRILIIEDYTADLVYTKRLLKRVPDATFDTRDVNTLEDGLEVLTAGGVDVVLLDLELPDSRGFDTLSKVLAKTSVPVIVLTGFHDQTMGIRAISMGARDYIIKDLLSTDILGRAILRQVRRERNKAAATSQSDQT